MPSSRQIGICASNEPCADVRYTARELAHKRSHIEADAYGERRDIDGSEANGDAGMARKT